MDSAQAGKPNQASTTVVVGGEGGGRRGGKGGARNDNDSKEIIGITVAKASNFSQWYQELVLKAELVEYYSEISGFYILRPSAMHIWNTIHDWFQGQIETMGVEEASFPMFLSSKSLEKEKEHVEGFAPELAWVTKAGEKDLEVPVAIRPTSEAVMYNRIALLFPSSLLILVSGTLTTLDGSAPIEIFLCA